MKFFSYCIYLSAFLLLVLCQCSLITLAKSLSNQKWVAVFWVSCLNCISGGSDAAKLAEKRNGAIPTKGSYSCLRNSSGNSACVFRSLYSQKRDKILACEGNYLYMCVCNSLHSTGNNFSLAISVLFCSQQCQCEAECRGLHTCFALKLRSQN